MEDIIILSYLNDFIFCPLSIYFHQLYGNQDTITYQTTYQINGTHAHQSIDEHGYSNKKNVLQGLAVYSDKYHLMGKIDIFDKGTGILTERKKYIKTIYDGYIFQLYGQYWGLTEMGYKVKKLKLYSYDDNKGYPIELPEKDIEMHQKFEALIDAIRTFDPMEFFPDNKLKCKNCIYEPACDRSLL